MKYSFWNDMFITALLWWVFGFSFMGFLIAVVAGAVLSIKITTAWHMWKERRKLNRVQRGAF